MPAAGRCPRFRGSKTTLKVWSGSQTENREVEVGLRGIGIPPEDVIHLFERFHRGRNSTEYPGNGLGLTIVKAIANAHSGAVHAESILGRGAKISIDLHPAQKG